MGLIATLGKAWLGGLVLSLIVDTSYLPYVGAIFATFVALIIYNVKTKGKIAKPAPSSPVPKGKIRICVAGATHSSPTSKAHYLADMLARAHPDKYESWYYFDSFAFYAFSTKRFAQVDFPEHLKGHDTMPFCWLEHPASSSEGVVDGANKTGNRVEPLGGSEHISAWAEKATKDAKVLEYARAPWKVTAYLTGTAFHCGEGRPKATAEGCISSACW